MKRLFTVILASTVVPFCLNAQPGMKPVPNDWLQDGWLIVPAFNFSIHSSSPDSKWLCNVDLPNRANGKSTAFLLENSDQSKFVVNVLEDSGRLNLSNSDEFVKGMRKQLPADWRLQNVRLEPSTLPLKGSTRFTGTIGFPSGSTHYIYGYIVSGLTSYQIITLSPSATEPAAFIQFAKSFKLLKPVIEAPAPASVGFFLLWSLWGAWADWRYTKRGGLIPTRKARIGLFVVLLLCCGSVVLVGIRGALPSSLTSFAVALLTFVFSLWELSRWAVRYRNPVFSFHVTQPQAS